MKEYILPICVDLGAKKTGVFSTLYEKNTKIQDIKNKQGIVYDVNHTKNSLIIANRTQNRHMKRGLIRKKLVKRLLKLIWENHFNLHWDENTQQTISFLLNRRGHSFFQPEQQEGHDRELLNSFPLELLDLFNEEFKTEVNRYIKPEGCNLNQYLQELIDNNEFDANKEKKINAYINKLGKTNDKNKDDAYKAYKKDNQEQVKEYIETFKEEVNINGKLILKAGVRPRSKYFKELETVLSNEIENEKKYCQYLGLFRKNLKTNKFNITKEQLKNLIGNLNNLELKDLRFYFNDINHMKKDFWDEGKLARVIKKMILDKWTMRCKVMNPNFKKMYGTLCSTIKKEPEGKIIDFLLKNNPLSTIPPYHNLNNKGINKCQSLILNPVYLDKNYPKWEKYLDILQEDEKLQSYLGSFEQDLKSLKSKKDEFYFVENKKEGKQYQGQRDYKDLKLRVLQFIFDRSKADDNVYQLNEIFSLTKRIKNNPDDPRELESKLKIIIGKLPKELQDKLSIHEGFTSGSFLHLVCKYYKQRKRAREGRFYIIPEGKNFMTHCNHKMRLKKYSLIEELANIFFVTPKYLKEKMGMLDEHNKGVSFDDVTNFFKERFKGFITICRNSAKMQKTFKNLLKENIEHVKTEKNLENISTDKDTTEKLNELKKLINKIESPIANSKDCYHALGKLIFDDDEELKFKVNKFNSIFTFIKLNQIIFKDRDGFSRTCAVCIKDNSHRMLQGNHEEKHISKAQRLPSIPTRVIDGAIRKLSVILSNNIIKDNWHWIEEKLKNKVKVTIPIIIESNKFDFELSLAQQKQIKKKNLPKKISIDQDYTEKSKLERIKSYSKYCAYTGVELIDEEGELDHIIPRSSKDGELNDEANLIYVSRKGNQIKSNRIYHLSDLHDKYKQDVFNKINDKDIEKEIETGLKHLDNKKYKNFANLTLEEKKAFKHALFLREENKLRKEVINIINRKNKTFVNGTQRYFAEVLSNLIYVKAKRKGYNVNKYLFFDYFGVPTLGVNNEKGISEVRKEYEAKDDTIAKFKKEDKEQKKYSHLIDAMIAFCISANNHKNGGSIGLSIENSFLYPLNEEDTKKTYLNYIKISEEEMLIKSTKNNQLKGHENNVSLTGKSIYSEKFLPILIHKKEDKIRVGFNWKNEKNSYEFKIDEKLLNNIVYCTRFINSDIKTDKIESLNALRTLLIDNNISSTTEYIYLSLDKRKVHQYFVQNYNTSLGYKILSPQDKFIRDLAYRLIRKNIKNFPNKKDNNEDNDNEIKKNEIKKLVTFKGKKIELPLSKDWNNIRINEKFSFNSTPKNHLKCRVEKSLPLKAREGKILLKRKDWRGGEIFQVVDNADSKSMQMFLPAYHKEKQTMVKAIAKIFVSKNIFILKNEEYFTASENVILIDKNRWFDIGIQNNHLEQSNIIKMAYRVDDLTRPSIRLVVKDEKYIEELINNVDYLKINNTQKKDDGKTYKQVQLQKSCKKGFLIEYKGKSYTNKMKNLLNESLKNHYEASSN